MKAEILITQVRDNEKDCDCEVLASCYNSRQLDSVIYSWDELVTLLREGPHMKVARMELRFTNGG